jgi:hypothetical protein
MRRMGLTAVACAAVVALMGTTAGASVHVDRHVEFSTLRHGWLFGMPRDVRANSRMVGLVDGHRLAVAPTRNGNFCEAFQQVASGCRGRAAGVIGAQVVFGGIGGDIVTAASGGHLFAAFDRGPQERVQVTWVSQPIAAGFFFVRVPAGAKTAYLSYKTPGGRVISTSGPLRIIHTP